MKRINVYNIIEYLKKEIASSGWVSIRPHLHCTERSAVQVSQLTLRATQPPALLATLAPGASAGVTSNPQLANPE